MLFGTSNSLFLENVYSIDSESRSVRREVRALGGTPHTDDRALDG